MWECDWNKEKARLPNKSWLEELARASNINLRDALFGGRAEVFKKYFKCTKGQIFITLMLSHCIPLLMLWMLMQWGSRSAYIQQLKTF